MNAYRAKYRDGTVQLLEHPPRQLAEKEQDVIVLFLGSDIESEQLTAMAADPEIRAELQRIEKEFSFVEPDGLENL